MPKANYFIGKSVIGSNIHIEVNFLLTLDRNTWSGRSSTFRALNSGLCVRGFDPHTGHGSLLKLRQFH